MSSSYSEYLRRKMAVLPRTYGPAVYGDASQRTAVMRYRNSKPPRPTLTTSTKPSCCGKVPSGGPYNGRNGDGQQQEWSVDGLIASRACCAPLAGTITVPGCCPPARPAGIYYDAAGIPLTAAYQGARLKCCDYQATLSTIPAPDCSCAINPNTRVNTATANDMPIVPPNYHTMKECCIPPVFPCPENPCCN